MKSISVKMIPIILYALLLFSKQDVKAQIDWPEDPQLKAVAEKRNALYGDALKGKKFRSAANYFYWLLKNTP